MDNNYWVEEIVKLYFKGCSVEEAIKIAKVEKKRQEIISIYKKWEEKSYAIC